MQEPVQEFTRSPMTPAASAATSLKLEHGFAVTLRELAWIIHHRAPDRAGVGPIPTTELALLKQILDAPNSTVGELSAALNIRQSNTSTAIRSLENRGFVERFADPEDGRVSRIRATPVGATEHFAISQAWAAGADEAISQLSAEHIAALENANEAMLALAQAIRKQGAH